MVASQPQRPTKTNAHIYFYIAGLLSGIGLVFLVSALLATMRSDYLQANLFMGMVGLLLVIMGLLPLMIFNSIWRRLPPERREGWSRLRFLRTLWAIPSLSVCCIGMGFFSQNILPLLLGTSSFVPDIISGLFMAGGLLLIVMQFKRLVPLHERWKRGQLENSQNLVHEE